MRPSPRSSLLERVARGYAAVAASRIAYGFLLIALIPLVTALGILVFGLLAVVVYGLFYLAGQPGPPISSTIGYVWFGGSLLIMFLVLRWGHRWLTRLLEIAEAPADWITPDADDRLDRPPAWDQSLDPVYRERVAAADARHASPPTASDDPPGPTDAESADDPREEP